MITPGWNGVPMGSKWDKPMLGCDSKAAQGTSWSPEEQPTGACSSRWGVTLKLPFTSGFTHLHPHLLLSYTISRDLIFMVCPRGPEGRLVAGGHHGGIDAGRHVELDGQQDIGDHRLGRVLGRLNMAPVQWGKGFKETMDFYNFIWYMIKIGISGSLPEMVDK